MSDENPRKRQIECHIKYDPKDKGKDIIYPFYFILLGIFSCICSTCPPQGELIDINHRWISISISIDRNR